MIAIVIATSIPFANAAHQGIDIDTLPYQKAECISGVNNGACYVAEVKLANGTMLVFSIDNSMLHRDDPAPIQTQTQLQSDNDDNDNKITMKEMKMKRRIQGQRTHLVIAVTTTAMKTVKTTHLTRIDMTDAVAAQVVQATTNTIMDSWLDAYQ
jgi:hypothetical protein